MSSSLSLISYISNIVELSQQNIVLLLYHKLMTNFTQFLYYWLNSDVVQSPVTAAI